jgi:hypothetical protein
MRNAALILGIIAGLIGMIVGLFGYGYAEITETHQGVGQAFGFLDNPALIRFASFFGPLLALAGGAMAKVRALWGGVLMLVAAFLFWQAFGFNVGTMFPIGFAALGGILAIAAGKPDEPKAHF